MNGGNKSVETNNNDVWKMSLFPAYNMASIGQLGNNKPVKAIVLTAMKYYWYNEFKTAQDALNILKQMGY